MQTTNAINALGQALWRSGELLLITVLRRIV